MLTIEEAQRVLDQYRFQESGEDIFPRQAETLTLSQLTHLSLLAEKVNYRNRLRGVEKRLTDLKEQLTGESV